MWTSNLADMQHDMMSENINESTPLSSPLTGQPWLCLYPPGSSPLFPTPRPSQRRGVWTRRRTWRTSSSWTPQQSGSSRPCSDDDTHTLGVWDPLAGPSRSGGGAAGCYCDRDVTWYSLAVALWWRWLGLGTRKRAEQHSVHTDGILLMA